METPEEKYERLHGGPNKFREARESLGDVMPRHVRPENRTPLPILKEPETFVPHSANQRIRIAPPSKEAIDGEHTHLWVERDEVWQMPDRQYGPIVRFPMSAETKRVFQLPEFKDLHVESRRLTL